MKLKVTVIRDLCISAGTCLIHAPNTFELDSENIAVIKDLESDSVASIIDAAKSCPTKAIIVHNAETGEQIWPIVNS
jgi:ferredoxin